MDVDVVISNALDELSNVLTSIADSPYSLDSHVRHIKLITTSPELTDQLESATELLASFFAAPPQVWSMYLQYKIQKLGIPESFENSEEVTDIDLKNVDLDALRDLFDCFRKATSDYLSIPILKKQIKLLIVLHASISSNPQLELLLSEEATRSAIDSAVTQGLGHLTEGNILWNIQIAWELAQLESKQTGTSERDALITRIETLHLDRLQQPHSGHDETLQSYSSFVTKYYSPDLYESRLVNASKLRTKSSRVWSRKEQHEMSLGPNPSRQQWETYITSEQKAKSSNDILLDSLFERAITYFASRRWETLINSAESSVIVDTQDALVFFWGEYLSAVRRRGGSEKEYHVVRRAIKNVPTSGYIWARYLRIMERIQETLETDTHELESIPEIYERALSVPEVKKNVKEVLQVILTKCSHDRRHIQGESDLNALFANLKEGIALVRNATKEGDPELSLEQFLSGVYLSLEPSLGQQAVALWQTTANHYKWNHVAWSKYLEVLISEGEYIRARNVFKNLPYKSINWPEPLWQQWMNFENIHGNLENIEECSERINNYSAKLHKKRQEEALQMQQAWLESSASASRTAQVNESENMAVNISSSETPDLTISLKRKAENVEEPGTSKRAKQDDAPMRDRENATVFVNYLPLTAKESDVENLFRDCGKIREIKLSSGEEFSVATVEFSDKDSVLAALTKDKKRIDNQEVTVHLAWKSTLYVTNFPEKMNDSSIRKLFEEYGEIFDVRWPSKKLKSSRRFCYVQYKNPDAALSALSLHGRELEPDQPLTVYISDPTRRQTRTDASANNREIYVAGLAKSVKEADLRILFSTFGTIRAIRMPLDEHGHAKGFGFVEFEDETSASSALKANNEEFKKRRLAVTLADKRAAKHKDESPLSRKARTIKVKNLPTGAQEGLLQQTMEKYGRVTRVEVFRKSNEALVEFENAHDIGRLLLERSSVMFGDQQLELMEHDLPATRGSSSSVSMFLPRGRTRPRAGLGSKKNDNHTQAKDTVSVPPSDGNKSQDDFRRMLNPNI